jgi:hypothetical protein
MLPLCGSAKMGSVENLESLFFSKRNDSIPPIPLRDSFRGITIGAILIHVCGGKKKSRLLVAATVHWLLRGHECPASTLLVISLSKEIMLKHLQQYGPFF